MTGKKTGGRADVPTRGDRSGLSARADFATLQKGLTGDRALIGESYMDDPKMLKVYLDYYWPVSRAQARHALSGCAPMRRVIDVGSGPGPVAAAFIDCGAEAVTLVDQSRRALDLALRELPRRCERAAAIASLVSDISSPDPALVPLWGSADCVSFGHSLNELWADVPDRIERRAALLDRYAEALAIEGRVLIIEPALLSTSRDLLAVRNLLVSRGWRVLSPCCGRAGLPCPALAAGDQQTCHDEIDWTPPSEVASLARSLNLDKDSLKMTWFLLSPPRAQQYLNPDADSFRVVSDQMLNKGGRLRRLVCGSAGRFPLSVVQGSPDEKRSGFDRLKRGDAIMVEKPELRENGWGVSGETKIRRI